MRALDDIQADLLRIPFYAALIAKNNKWFRGRSPDFERLGQALDSREEIRELLFAGDDNSGNGFLAATTQRLLFVPWSRDGSPTTYLYSRITSIRTLVKGPGGQGIGENLFIGLLNKVFTGSMVPYVDLELNLQGRRVLFGSQKGEAFESMVNYINTEIARAATQRHELPPIPSDRIAELDHLASLRERGVLTDEEFAIAKRRILGY